MQFIQSDPGNTPIEELLNKVDAASAEDLSPNPSRAEPPTLRDFLDEEGQLIPLFFPPFFSSLLSPLSAPCLFLASHISC